MKVSFLMFCISIEGHLRMLEIILNNIKVKNL